jgi:hypothetical protein
LPNLQVAQVKAERWLQAMQQQPAPQNFVDLSIALKVSLLTIKEPARTAKC